jgi:hypothetical protein
VLRDASGVVAWLNYHRSRVRLARALAVFLPPIAVTSVLGVGRLEGPDWKIATHWTPDPLWFGVVPAVYGFVIWWIVARRAHPPEPPWLRAPKTNKSEAYAYGKDQGYAADDDESQRLQRRTRARALVADPAVQGATVLHLSAVSLAFAIRSEQILRFARS